MVTPQVQSSSGLGGGDKDRGSSFQEAVSHTYTFRLD